MHSYNKQMIMLTICNYGRTPFQVINFLYRMITAKNIFNCQNQSKPYTGHRLVDQTYIKSYASLKSVLQFQTHAQIYVTCIFLYIYTSIYRVTPLYNILYSLISLRTLTHDLSLKIARESTLDRAGLYNKSALHFSTRAQLWGYFVH